MSINADEECFTARLKELAPHSIVTCNFVDSANGDQITMDLKNVHDRVPSTIVMTHIYYSQQMTVISNVNPILGTK